MSSLIRVELARYGSRRAIALLLLAIVALAALLAVKTAWDSRPMSAQEIATAEAQADIERTRTDIAKDLANCLRDPEDYLGPGSTAQLCRDVLAPAPKSFLPRAPLDLAGTLQGNGIGLAVLVIALLVIAASTYAGGDWASGSIRTQLLFEPRRLRLWSAKAIAVALWSGLVALVALGGFWAATYAVAESRDLSPSDGVLTDVGLHLLRAVVLAMGAGVGAYALTMVFRHTVGTLALLFAYSVGGELLVALPFDTAPRWSLGNNVFGWLDKSLTYFDPGRCDGLLHCSRITEMTNLDAGLYLLVLLLVAVVLSVVTFTRRDA